MSRIIFDPSIPLSLWFPLLLAAAAVLACYGWSSRKRITGRRYWTIMTLMSIAFALPLIVLLNPTWTEPIPPPPGKPMLTILLDQSASMSVDLAPGRTRYEEAAAQAAAVVKQFESKYEVRLFGFDKELKNMTGNDVLSQQPEGTTTDLAAALEQALDSERPQGQFILLLSDGAHNQGSLVRLRESLTKAKAMATPVFTRTFAGASEVNDLELELGLSQEIAFAAQHVPVTVHLRQRGTSIKETHISLKLGDQILEERNLAIPESGVVETTWTVTQPKSGLYRYEFCVEPFPGEVTVVNNTATLLLRVVEEPVRVLLLEGKPYWDTKYLVRTLSADPSIELTSVVQVAEGRLHRRTITSGTESKQNDPAKTDNWTIETEAGQFLAGEGQIDQYQIIILGRDAEIFLSTASDSLALARLKKWLTEGNGSLVCFRGSPTSQVNERLGQLLPVRWEPSQESRFRLQMTPAGQALRWLPGNSESDDPLFGMPSLATGTAPGTLKPLAVVLAVAGEGGQAAPVITYQPVGNGRVVVVEGAGMWRWAFLPPTFQDRDEIYAALWRSLVRWLVSNVGLLPTQDLALRTDTTTFSTDEAAMAMLLLREDRIGGLPEVELSGEMLEKPRLISPVPAGGAGQYRLIFGRLPEGHYRVRVVGDQKDEISGLAEFDVRGNLRERLDIAAQPEVMQMIASRTGGAEISGGEESALARYFEEHLHRIHPIRNTQTPLWDRWWILCGIVFLWTVSWMLRRSSGLV
jgi:hypothetical protein